MKRGGVKSETSEFIWFGGYLIERNQTNQTNQIDQKNGI
jgi:hypothetical protein